MEQKGGFLNAAGASVACSYNRSFRAKCRFYFLINQNAYILQEYRRRDKSHTPAGSNYEQAELM
jgi:hypothetical protein